MNCPQCNSPAAEGKKYCADCGAPLDAQTKYLESFAHRQIQDEINKRFKDQKFIEIETSQAIAERLYLWTKIFGACVALPVAALLIILGIFGINKYSDFTSLIDEIEQKVKPQVEQAKTTAEQAQKAASQAQTEAETAEHTIETATAQIKTQVGSVNQVVRNVQDLSGRMSGLEKQTSTQVHASTERVDQRVSELDQKIDAATKDIAEQQRKLANTDEIVKALFSKGITEYFPTTANASNILVVPLPHGALVFMLLQSAPIYQTLEVKWKVYSQPRGSYGPRNNLVIFSWGDPAENLKQNPLEVTYVPDPTSKIPIFKTLSMKDKSVFADDTKVMALP